MREGSCSCCWPRVVPAQPQRSRDPPPPPSALFFSSLFSLFSTSFVSLCFTLCFRITLWVVRRWNMWGFLSQPPTPRQGSVYFWSVEEFFHGLYLVDGVNRKTTQFLKGDVISMSESLFQSPPWWRLAHPKLLNPL